MPTQFTTGAARIIWGNPINGKSKTDQFNKAVLDIQGQPILQWAFGIAIPKADFPALWAAMNAEVAPLFPQGVPANFSWKIKDGDGPDNKGIPYSAREGYAGCYALTISTESFAPRVVNLVNGSYQDVVEGGIKTGDYVRAAVSLKAHPGTSGTPGIYVNPVMIEFLGYGEAINNGPDAMAVFGGQTVALPAGASNMPTAPVGAMPIAGAVGAVPLQPAAIPGAPVAVPGQPIPAAYPQPTMPTVSPSNVPPAPAHDFVAAAAPGMPGQPVAAPGMPGQPTHYQPQ